MTFVDKQEKMFSLCFWTIPTVGFYRKHGEVTSPPSSRNYSTIILSACKRSAGGTVVVDVTMTASPPPASAVGLSCQYWINLESIWLGFLIGSRREDDDDILWLSGAHHVQCTYRLSLSYNCSWQWRVSWEKENLWMLVSSNLKLICNIRSVFCDWTLSLNVY